MNEKIILALEHFIEQRYAIRVEITLTGGTLSVYRRERALTGGIPQSVRNFLSGVSVGWALLAAEEDWNQVSKFLTEMGGGVNETQ